MKFCVDCRHMHTFVSLVTRKVELEHATCDVSYTGAHPCRFCRLDGGACGPEGKLFEVRDGGCEPSHYVETRGPGQPGDLVPLTRDHEVKR